MSQFLESLNSQLSAHENEGRLSPKTRQLLYGFCSRYMNELQRDLSSDSKLEEEVQELMKFYMERVLEQESAPFSFGVTHAKRREPFDHYVFGNALIGNMVADAKLIGKEYLEEMEAQLERGENVILLANHQSEADPHALSFLLQNEFSRMASTMVFVAGERVLKDPLAVPLSLGRDLLCIYSKKYIDTPPELRAHKIEHNHRALQELEKMLKAGGLCLYIAPNGGRDRPNAEGIYEVAEFDAQNIEMLTLIAKRAATPTHFYPLALKTYEILPPPQSRLLEIGEERYISRGFVGAHFGAELCLEPTQTLTVKEKKAAREERAREIHQIVVDLYQTI
ncbi:MAG: 1-acyl-sn-glycerol-3-phosphate acyltransferase [Chlamydiia bacterium]|nr:1-acyl-sn-glycerol-3-phosphate acyltransferase [Chlamydiia bacterium]